MLAERAELVARLSLQDDFTRRANGVRSSLRGLEGSFGKIGATAKRGLQNAASNLTAIGAVAGGVVALNVKQGIASLAELEDATTAVDGAIHQMGLTGKVTAAQIATWANEIESSVQAAFDDKEITAAAAGLIRYGKIAASNLRPALVVMTDLAAKTGSVDSAATLLGKALAAPEKAAGRLTRAGVVLTKKQQSQIEKLVKAGKSAKAQALLLDILAKSTKGAAAASAGPYRDALNTLKDVTEDAQRVLGEAFLPLLSRVAAKLSTAISDPKFIQNVRDFGKTLADGLDSALTIASKIPWGQIGDSLKIAGAGAKAVFDAFAGLPPWIQTAVLTGWGLNKLTGGALGSIVGELGKGLIRGVLGMNAGVVNINAGVVNGGGVGGAAGAAAKGGLSAASKLFLVGEAIGLIAAVEGVRESISNGLTQQATDIHDAVSSQINAAKPDAAKLAQSLAGVQQGIDAIRSNPLNVLVGGDALNELEKMRAELGSALTGSDDKNKASFRLGEHTEDPAKRLTPKQLKAQEKAAAEAAKTKAAVDRARDATESARIRITSGVQGTTSRVGDLNRTAGSGLDHVVNAINRNGRQQVNLSVVVNGSNVKVTKTYSNGDIGGGGGSTTRKTGGTSFGI